MATNVNERYIEVILPNQIGYERIAMASSASFAKMFGFSRARIEDLKTVVSEAAVNAMQHGNKGRPDARVTIRMNLENDTIYVTVMDDGEGIKKISPKPDCRIQMINNSVNIGLGIDFLDALAIIRHGDINRIVLEIHLDGYPGVRTALVAVLHRINRRFCDDRLQIFNTRGRKAKHFGKRG